MRGLPPVPDEVLEATFHYSVEGSSCSLTLFFWLQASSSWSEEQLIAVVDAIVFEYFDLTTSLTTEHAQLARVAAILHGPTLRRYDKAIAPNHGAWPGTALLNTCVDVYWFAGDAGKRGHSVSHFPTFPRDFTDDGVSLNSNGFVNVQDSAALFLSRVSAIPTPTSTAVLPVTVHRQAHGAPLSAAYVTTILRGFPVPYVGTLRRRISKSGPVAPE